MNVYATEQAMLRNNGYENDIDAIIVGTPSEGMTSDDFLSYLGDFPAGYVQYGNTKGFCDSIAPLADKSDKEVFNTMIRAEIAQGDDPIEYDTRPGTKIHSTEIDVDYSGRSWTC